MGTNTGQQIYLSRAHNRGPVLGHAMPSGRLTLTISIRGKGRIAPLAAGDPGISLPTFRGSPPLLYE